MIALIPARSGSTRIQAKNIKTLGGRPLIEYTIEAAIKSEVFARSDIYVTTDCQKTITISEKAGARIILRPEQYAHKNSPDFEFLWHAMEHLEYEGDFMILRPTNPFRTPALIQRAFKEWDPWHDSLRAVEPVKQHAAKCYTIAGSRLLNFVPGMMLGQPYCDMPTQMLVGLVWQNGCIQIVKTATLRKYRNPSGLNKQKFIVTGLEALNLDTPEDWEKAEEILRKRNGKTTIQGPKRKRARKVAARDFPHERT